MENKIIKEGVKPLNNKEFNNNLIVDTLIKCSKALQLVNVLLDFNNSPNFEVDLISDADFQAIQNNEIELIKSLKNVVDKFNNKYNGGVTNNVESKQDADNADLQEPQND